MNPDDLPQKGRRPSRVGGGPQGAKAGAGAAMCWGRKISQSAVAAARSYPKASNQRLGLPGIGLGPATGRTRDPDPGAGEITALGQKADLRSNGWALGRPY